MDWQDEGVILSMRPHGESAAIIHLFTRAHGRHAGVVRGGASRRMAAHLQPGTQVAATWRARLSDHIGAFTLDPVQSRAHLMQDRLSLAALSSVCALLQASLPEREPHPALWQDTMAFLAAIDTDAGATAGWLSGYLRWELRLLGDLGFGLDLQSCAVTGATTDLAYVSPRTGRAVSIAGAGEWSDRLFPLPAGIEGTGPMAPDALAQGLAITSHFLSRELAQASHPGAAHTLPEARGRLLDLIARHRAATGNAT